MAKKNDKYVWFVGSEPPPIEHHSIIKHKILQEYLDAYVRVVTANPRIDRLTLSVIDGFAGGGEYVQENGSLCDGSPIIAMDAIEAADVAVNLARGKLCKIDARYYFVEKRGSNFEYLRHHVGLSRPHQLPKYPISSQ